MGNDGAILRLPKDQRWTRLAPPRQDLHRRRTGNGTDGKSKRPGSAMVIPEPKANELGERRHDALRLLTKQSSGPSAVSIQTRRRGSAGRGGPSPVSIRKSPSFGVLGAEAIPAAATRTAVPTTPELPSRYPAGCLAIASTLPVDRPAEGVCGSRDPAGGARQFGSKRTTLS